MDRFLFVSADDLVSDWQTDLSYGLSFGLLFMKKRRIFMNGKETLRPHVVKLWTQREKYLLQIKQCVRFL